MTAKTENRWTGYLIVGSSTDPDRVPPPSAEELAELHRRVLRDPAVRRFRDEVRSREPLVRIVLPGERAYRARAHGTIVGGTTLCGKDLIRPTLDPPGQTVVECGKCLTIMDAEDLDYD